MSEPAGLTTAELQPGADTEVSVVIIGRSEGERLTRCLASVQAARWGTGGYELIYVDSRSTDDSMARALGMGARALPLEDASPCAAKARNLGWRHARGEYVLFLDGDTELHPDFVPRALAILHGNAQLCAIWGHRRESHPEQSLYTRVLDLDWVYPVGRTLYFGGDVLVRRAALAVVDGFDPTLKAGEEPELCARLRAAGWEIEHIDAPMTRHDLAITSFRAYWLRAFRSGIAYAEVAERMRQRGDVLWQYEAARDFRHGLLFLAAPFLLLLTWLWSPLAALMLIGLAAAFIARTAHRCAWKAPGQPALCWQYALHSHFQKIPALFGQLQWRQARRRQTEIGLVDYKTSVPANLNEGSRHTPQDERGFGTAEEGVFHANCHEGTHHSLDNERFLRKFHANSSTSGRRSLKHYLAQALIPLARLWRKVFVERWLRLWSLARLREASGRTVHASNVVLGPVEVQGTANITFGQDALLYPGCYLETQGAGRIEIGDGVVLSRGVHIVAFEQVTLGQGTMVGEYASLRDANHRLDPSDIRHSGHDSAPIRVGRNVWIGRGAVVLKGVQLGDSCVVAANAVVNRAVAAGEVVGGVPARTLRVAVPGSAAISTPALVQEAVPGPQRATAADDPIQGPA